MAIYLWLGEEPEAVYVANRHGVRVRTRDAFFTERDEHRRYGWLTRGQLKIDGKWRQEL